MAKKNNKTKNVVETAEVTTQVTPTPTETSLNNTPNVEIPTITKPNIKSLNVVELIALEKACALLCKRYETMARLDIFDNFKFKEYQRYYETIFEELAIRVAEVCKED
jgi:hypothetical protein